ncbi:MAG TPA: S-adenosyl-l-methionine hydroxide adenosyltransferase family protein [Chryseolinea sp.]|nr:S-adenosyl-l-methionine hydroxide adenosyltransferase family protein [Chryseolinea sp.]
MLLRLFVVVVSVCLSGAGAYAQSNALVFQSDFGLNDGAVGAMKGVAFSVSRSIPIFDITHEIPAYNIWEAAYRLHQAAAYWPPGTVFVSIVDPGVGSTRRSVVLKTRTGHYFVTPDNGTLTLVASSLGIEQVREINEAKNRLQQSGQSHTFHGRDVYAYTGARLAAGVITFEEVGPVIQGDIVTIPFQSPKYDQGEVRGNIPVLDIQYGNVWTNVDVKTFEKLQVHSGELMLIKIYHDKALVYEGKIPYVRTFAEVPEGKPLGYLNSLLNFSIGINRGSFSKSFHVESGADWSVVLKKA